MFRGEKHHDQAHMSIMCSPQPKMAPRGRLSLMRHVASHMSRVGLRTREERLKPSQIKDLVKGQPWVSSKEFGHETYSLTITLPTRPWLCNPPSNNVKGEEVDTFGWI